MAASCSNSCKCSTADDCVRWIEQQQRVHDVSVYGSNKQSIREQLVEQQTRCDDVINCFANQQQNEWHLSDSEQQAFSVLQATGEQRLACLKTLSELDNLEHVFAPLVTEFSLKAVELVAKADKQTPGLTSDHSQSCILAVRNNWAWISKQLKCSEIHLQNAAEYHQVP
jgi:hypothetical protein